MPAVAQVASFITSRAVRGIVAAADGSRLVFDDKGRAAVLFVDQWPERFFKDRNKGIELSPVPFEQGTSAASPR